MEHTPTPWNYSIEKVTTSNTSGNNRKVLIGIGNTFICSLRNTVPTNTPTEYPEQAIKDAEFIVRAVNAHDELVAILKGILVCDENRKIELPNYLYNDIKKALAKAEGAE